MQKILCRAGALALVLIGTAAQAHVLDKRADASAFALRADIAKRTTKYTSCLVQAVLKCERRGATSAPECDLATGAVAYEPAPGTETTKFQLAVTKCDDKIGFQKKGTDYQGIGCPGDCDEGEAGLQQCATMAAYEDSVTGTSPASAKTQIGVLLPAIDGACAGAGTPDSAARIDCVDDATKQLAKYAKRLFACAQRCETDVAGNKGGGALTNADVCLVGLDAHPALAACAQRAIGKLVGPPANDVAPLVAAAVNAATDRLFNREAASDPDSPAGTLSPCGTCGDGSREGTEACDGADLGDCEACAADCTCTPAVCGNGVIEGSEACDGATLGTCITTCENDCTCAPQLCGNGVVEGTEACDGAALGTCTTSCEADCTCTPDLDDPILDGPAGSFCSTAFNAASADYQPICVPTEGSGHHFRIEGAQVFAQNGFFYLALGFPEMATGNPATTLGDGRFIFTGGKSQSCTFGWSYFRYSGITDPPAASLCTPPSIFGDWMLGPQEICLDVSDKVTPNVTFWVTGKNGANCKDRSTLTLATASYTKSDWASANNRPISELVHYVKVNNAASATMQNVLVSSRTVLDYGPEDPILDGPAGTSCTTAFNPASVDYQPLCVPTEASGRHFRIEGGQALGNNGFFYLALGFPAVPAGNPATAVGDGRFIFTGGKSQSCSFSWSYFRYSGITDPAAASLCTPPPIFGDYHLGPQEVCLDVTADNPPRVTFWATGQEGADCKDRGTLTEASALYTKDDWASANNQPVSDVTHFVKVSNTALATLGSVGVSSRLVLD